MGDFYLPDQAEINWLSRSLTSSNITLKLYKNVVTYSAGLTAASFTEATFTGYAAKTLSSASWVVTSGDPGIASYNAAQTFTSSATQTLQTIYGWYIIHPANGQLLGYEQFDAGVDITANGDAIEFTPKLTLAASEVIMPTGVIVPFGGSSAPAGHLLCNGAAVSRTTYADLFAVIGTTYGAGDGSTTFNVPDMRGRFPLGKAASGTGSTLGGTGGAIDHTHGLANGYAFWFANTYNFWTTKVVSSWTSNRKFGSGAITTAGDTSIEAVQLGGTTDGGNPPFVSLQYVIKT